MCPTPACTLTSAHTSCRGSKSRWKLPQPNKCTIAHTRHPACTLCPYFPSPQRETTPINASSGEKPKLFGLLGNTQDVKIRLVASLIFLQVCQIGIYFFVTTHHFSQIDIKNYLISNMHHSQTFTVFHLYQLIVYCIYIW